MVLVERTLLALWEQCLIFIVLVSPYFSRGVSFGTAEVGRWDMGPSWRWKCPSAVPKILKFKLLLVCPDVKGLCLLSQLLFPGRNVPAPVTKAAYIRALNMYHPFCASYNLCLTSTLPISVNKLSLFIVYLYEKGLPASSIFSLLSTISYHHKILPDIVENNDPTKVFIIRHLLTGIRTTPIFRLL